MTKTLVHCPACGEFAFKFVRACISDADGTKYAVRKCLACEHVQRVKETD